MTECKVFERAKKEEKGGNGNADYKLTFVLCAVK